jgi:hypothetical protein
MDELPYEPTMQEWEDFFERANLEHLLAEGLPGKETQETRFFRQAARERKVHKLDELEALQVEFPTPPSYPAALEKELAARRKVWGSYLVQPRKRG